MTPTALLYYWLRLSAYFNCMYGSELLVGDPNQGVGGWDKEKYAEGRIRRGDDPRRSGSKE